MLFSLAGEALIWVCGQKAGCCMSLLWLLFSFKALMIPLIYARCPRLIKQCHMEHTEVVFLRTGHMNYPVPLFYTSAMACICDKSIRGVLLRSHGRTWSLIYYKEMTHWFCIVFDAKVSPGVQLSWLRPATGSGLKAGQDGLNLSPARRYILIRWMENEST